MPTKTSFVLMDAHNEGNALFPRPTANTDERRKVMLQKIHPFLTQMLLTVDYVIFNRGQVKRMKPEQTPTVQTDGVNT
ncbi:hypothetical protein TNCV_3048581 [Trichonephila clavipes]|nr:hypothetical protein TNCV_3048581 [Trichonephila clavipes]